MADSSGLGVKNTKRIVQSVMQTLQKLGADHVTVEVARQDKPLAPLQVTASRW